jgi:hypothetical protein
VQRQRHRKQQRDRSHCCRRMVAGKPAYTNIQGSCSRAHAPTAATAQRPWHECQRLPSMRCHPRTLRRRRAGESRAQGSKHRPLASCTKGRRPSPHFLRALGMRRFQTAADVRQTAGQRW